MHVGQDGDAVDGVTGAAVAGGVGGAAEVHPKPPTPSGPPVVPGESIERGAAPRLSEFTRVCRAIPGLARVDGNPPFQLQQSLRANITTVSGGASRSVGAEGSFPRAPTGTQG